MIISWIQAKLNQFFFDYFLSILLSVNTGRFSGLKIVLFVDFQLP